jgi:hypothetical protein
MPQQRPRMPQESPASDEMGPNGLFDRYASEQPQLHSYQAMADRDVPMIVLTPVRPAPAHLGSEAGR